MLHFSPFKGDVVVCTPERGENCIHAGTTLTTHKDVRSYPCRSLESAIKLGPVGERGEGRHGDEGPA